MGEIGVGQSGDTLVTLLGSCVAVVLFDPNAKKAALAHIQLPASSSSPPVTNPATNLVTNTDAAIDTAGKYADTAIPALMREFSTLNRSQLIVHLAGGADMFKTSRLLTVGKLNVQAAERLLGQLNLSIVSHDCGGPLARRVRFEVSTGMMLVEKVEKPTELNT
ncbi:Chemoreceptor glutamine deamidase CheD [Rubripirellula obstinata]|uniref:Probable chemoreceptor glutamine deamidase CheD n=2 Tax=Rubripirellula obstinata TaxID=406547 RepID=A0A5B1CQX9_9BACT|nr:Chemoreceptor glutamine deamidase CheD [Rubripirellula obstinata]